MDTVGEYHCCVATLGMLSQCSQRSEGVGQHRAQHQRKEENPRHYCTYRIQERLTLMKV